VAARLRVLVDNLNAVRFALILDNFESNLEEGTRRILDSELAEFYRYLLTHLAGSSRLIITSRYLPSAVEPLPSTVRAEDVGEFTEAAFLKFLLRDQAVEQRYRRGELAHEGLVRLHGVLGGTPRFLAQMREVLKTMTAAELDTELDRVVLPVTQAGEPG